ncbi:MAG: hypothetical protein OXD46_06345 [Chloroflexi bacterium]|nr:hypothetical protein [Chloroflexota bacterium]
MKTLLAGLTILLIGTAVGYVAINNTPPDEIRTKPTTTHREAGWKWTPQPTPTITPRPTWGPVQRARQQGRVEELTRTPTPTPSPVPTVTTAPPVEIHSVEDFEAWCESNPRSYGIFHEMASLSVKDEKYKAKNFNDLYVWGGEVRSSRAPRHLPFAKDGGILLQYVTGQDVYAWPLPAGSHCVHVSGASSVSINDKIAKVDARTIVRIDVAGNYVIQLRPRIAREAAYARCRASIRQKAEQEFDNAAWALAEAEQRQREIRLAARQGRGSDAALDRVQTAIDRLKAERGRAWQSVRDLEDRCDVNVQVLTYYPKETAR